MQAANDVKSHPYLLTTFACQKILMGLSLIYPYPFLYLCFEPFSALCGFLETDTFDKLVLNSLRGIKVSMLLSLFTYLAFSVGLRGK